MEVLNFILIAVFGIVSAIKIMMIALGDDDSNAAFCSIIFFAITAILCCLSTLCESAKLKEEDVLDGEAEYVGTIHISKGDTIRTYNIQPIK